MFKKPKNEDAFFDGLCAQYYEKLLLYLRSSLGNEEAARDCVQDVFLTAYRKRSLLEQHPNPGGFLFQTAKNLTRKTRREGFARMLREQSADEEGFDLADPAAGIETALDREIDEHAYIGAVLDQLSEEKRALYTLYYVVRLPIVEIAARHGLEEPALRMRYVRLRREIRAIASRVAEHYFTG